MSQEFFATLMTDFAKEIGLDWQDRENHNMAVLRFGENEVTFRYDASRNMLALSCNLLEIDPTRDYAVCLMMLNLNANSHYTIGLNESNHLVLAHRLLIAGLRGVEFERHIEDFLNELDHLHKAFEMFGVKNLFDFLASCGHPEQPQDSAPPESVIINP